MYTKRVIGGRIMSECFNLYSMLFNAITDAVAHIGASNYGLAKDVLIAAQAEAEELYIESE